jgi:ABC-type transport system substrate-binding protein
LYSWPHAAPGDTEPFDAHLIGFAVAPEGEISWYHSREATSEEHPDGLNLTGFTDPELDALIDRIVESADPAERRAAMRSGQTILARELPSIPAWFFLQSVLLRDDLATRDGQLDLRTWRWNWRLEDIVRVTDQ